MKSLITLLFVAACQSGMAQDLKSVLLKQLHSTHDEKDWFVDANSAVAGLTAEQASWKDVNGGHSVGQLTYHIVFWNQRTLDKLLGKSVDASPSSNETTFDSFDKKQWTELVKHLNDVMVGIEKFVSEADEKKLKEIAPTIANISTHNAYHVGQIVSVRKLQKSWDPKKGVN